MAAWVWALGMAAAQSRWSSIRSWALKLFDETAPCSAELTAPRALGLRCVRRSRIARSPSGSCIGTRDSAPIGRAVGKPP